MTKDSVREQVFQSVAQIEGFEPYQTPYANDGAFLIDAGRPAGSVEDRGVFVVRVEEFHFDPDD